MSNRPGSSTPPDNRPDTSDSELEGMTPMEIEVAENQEFAMNIRIQKVGRVFTDHVRESEDLVDEFVDLAKRSTCTAKKKRKLSETMQGMLNLGKTEMHRMQNRWKSEGRPGHRRFFFILIRQPRLQQPNLVGNMPSSRMIQSRQLQGTLDCPSPITIQL